ncbi:MAG TPA: Bug family tripartite tricarboxylate transporter substrate binding protein [Burkholderiaceae bacterium]|nr:Bug family tripartite tricarboxylate transporter substrate binding protein [Burkholderiaceae bacterium]
MDRRQFLGSTTLAAAASLLPSWAGAQSLDNARVLCGFPAGGTTDAVSRRVADKLRGTHAKAVVVENKPGAGGRIAVEDLKRSAPDGSTLLLTPAAMITLYPHIYTKLPYGIDDVTPVCTACTIAFAFGVGPSVPESVKTLKDFLAWAKANPAQANYASPGAGSPPHLIGALLAKESGVDLRHVAYKGSAPGINDLLGGQIASMSSPIGDYLQHMKAGKVRLLATSGPKRSRFAPDTPTYTEQGFKALEMTEWYGFFLPPKAAPELTQKLAQNIRAAVMAPDVIDAFLQLGLEAAANTPEQLTQVVKTEHAAWKPIVQRVGFTPES